jgi:hypothetical protein
LPQFLSAYSEDGFDQFLGPGTPVASLGSSLSSADASQDFSMTFIFDKGMDALSVQNPANWRISRSTNGGIGGVYNWGLPISQTEVEIAPVPQRVIYDSGNLTAEVTFSITQNSSADGTLDPSHILFRFYGKDVYGNSMDPASDQYSGISKIV